jgi:hypothetical protein
MSAPHVHQANGRAERAIGLDLKLMRAVMARHSSPKDLWEYAIDYVIHTRNRLVESTREDGMCPEQRSCGEAPDLSIARPFDAPAWYFVYPEERMRAGAVFKPRVHNCRIVGYSRVAKGSYLVLDSKRRELTRSQVYCKEYPGLLGLENLNKQADPIDKDGRLRGGEVSHSTRMKGDRALAARGTPRPVSEPLQAPRTAMTSW